MKNYGVRIDKELCTSCGACVEECCANLFIIKTGPYEPHTRVIHHDQHSWCTGCGHCLAVCPQGAIRCDGEAAPVGLAGIEHPEQIFDYQKLLPFLQSKRSVRRYRHKEVSQEQIMAVLEAMRWAPSGHNMQASRYLVITERSVLQEITDHTIEGFRKFRVIIRLRKLLRPFLPVNLYRVFDSPGLLEGVNDMIHRQEEGQDPILFNAPAVIVVYYPNMGPLSLIDPTIAFTYGMLAAHSMGLGSCWIGFAIQSLYKNKAMRKLLGVPSDMIVAGVMTLGYPLPVYHRVPPRNDVQVRWLENGHGGTDAIETAVPADSMQVSDRVRCKAIPPVV